MRWLRAGTVAAAALIVLLFLCGASVTARDAVVLTLALLVQSWAGAYWWVRLRRGKAGRRPDLLECIGAGLALGTLLSAVTFAAAAAAGLTGPVWVLPALLALLDWGYLRVRGERVASLQPVDPGTMWAAVLGLVVGLATLVLGLRRYPLPFSDASSATYHPDMLTFEALANSLGANGLRLTDSLPAYAVGGGRLAYHWLAYGWAGSMSVTLGTGPYVTLTRAVPIVAIMGLVMLVASWTRALTTSRLAPTLAVLLVVAGGFVGAELGSTVNLDSPSQTMSILWLVLLLRLATLTASGAIVPIGGLALTGIASFAVTGGKASSALLAVAGTLAVALGARAASRAVAWLTALSCCLGLVVGYAFFLFGLTSTTLNVLSLTRRASTGLGLDPWQGSMGAFMGTVILVLAVLPRWTGAFWSIADSSAPRQESHMALGVMVAAIGPLLLLSQGVNEVWGASAASGPLAPVAAAGVALAWRRLNRPALRWCAVLAGLASVPLSAYLYSQGAPGSSTSRWMAPLAPYAAAGALALVIALWRGAHHRVVMGLAAATVILTLASLAGRLIVNLS